MRGKAPRVEDDGNKIKIAGKRGQWLVGNSPSRPDTAGAQAYSAEAQNQVGHIREPQRAPKLEGPGTSEGGVQGWGRESLVRSSQIPLYTVQCGNCTSFTPV